MCAACTVCVRGAAVGVSMHLVDRDNTFDSMFYGTLVVELQYGGKLERVSNPGTHSADAGAEWGGSD